MKQAFTHGKIVLASILLTTAAVFYSCKSEVKQEKGIPEFKVMEIKGKKVPVYLQMVGQAAGIPTVDIRARVAGYLQNWSFKEGSLVRKGQVLFTIEPDEYKNDCLPIPVIAKNHSHKHGQF